MGTKSRVMTGARALIFVEGVLVGLFDSCSWSSNLTTETIHIVGAYGPVEITPTAMEAIDCSCSGFRIIGNGGHILPKFPKLQDLLNLETITLTLVDRQADASAPPIMVLENVIPTSYGTGVNAKATSRIQISYRGTKVSDESGLQAEGGAANLP